MAGGALADTIADVTSSRASRRRSVQKALPGKRLLGLSSERALSAERVGSTSLSKTILRLDRNPQYQRIGVLPNSGTSCRRTHDGERLRLPLKSPSNVGVTMRKLFILSALVFALVSGATATVVAMALQAQTTTPSW